MRFLRLVDALLDRAGLWPTAILGVALIAGGYGTGLLDQIWSFPVWLQIAIFAGLVLLAIWVMTRGLKWVVKPSPRELQDQIHSLWKRGEVLLGSGDAEDPDWGTWRDEVVAFYARHANAADRAWLDTNLVAGRNTKGGMDGLAELGRRLDRH